MSSSSFGSKRLGAKLTCHFIKDGPMGECGSVMRRNSQWPRRASTQFAKVRQLVQHNKRPGGASSWQASGSRIYKRRRTLCQFE